MGTVNPCQLQIRTERPTSAFLGCVAAQSSPSAPGFNNMSNPFSLTQSRNPLNPLAASAHMLCACPNIEAGPSGAMLGSGQGGPTCQCQLRGESQEPLNVCTGPWDLFRVLSQGVVAWGAGRKNWAIGLTILRPVYRLTIANCQGLPVTPVLQD